jgi:polysaccharide export outer membrane protein
MKKVICALCFLFAATLVQAQGIVPVGNCVAGVLSEGCTSSAAAATPDGSATPSSSSSDRESAQASPAAAAAATEAKVPAPVGPPSAAGASAVGASADTPLAATDFQKFVSSAIGHSLPVFGSGLFTSSSAGFAPSTNIPVPADYVVGPGDEILIRAWGKINIDRHLTVDRSGQVFLPQVGTLTVAGLRMDQLNSFFQSAIEQQFTGFQLTVSLGQLRSIQIFALGEVRHAGVYTISSLSTLVNALFASGGPSSTGSLRDIQLKRNGKVITHFDVYRLLIDGDKSADVHLLPGDIIYIPPVGPQVALDGNVNTPAIYELKGSETAGELIQEAGGLTVIAGTSRAVLEQIVNHSYRTVEEFPLDAANLTRQLHNGDILRISPIVPKIENAVTLRGNVLTPGIYSWHPGMRVSDIIPNREFLLSRAYYEGQNALSGSGTDKPAIGGHETEINWNYAVIERLNKADLTTNLIPFVLGEAVDNHNSLENKELQPSDVIVVYSRSDIALPDELKAKYIHIDGQVHAPGTYRVEEGETLRDIVRRAGGLAPHAYLYASELTRESVRAEQNARLKEIVQLESQELLAPSNTVASFTFGQTAGAQSSQLDERRAYIARLNDIHPTGRVVLRLQPQAQGINDVPDFVLEDGDSFFVPALSNTISVLGNVYNPGAVRYEADNRYEQYLDIAGGPTRTADKKREFLIRADGTVVSRQQRGSLGKDRLAPGDTVVVPPKLKPGNPLDLTALASIIGSIALSAAVVRAVQ